MMYMAKNKGDEVGMETVHSVGKKIREFMRI